MKPDIATWIMKLKDGRKVKVDYKSHGLSESMLCPHLEFHGFSISETGYRSHFFGSLEEKPDLDWVHQYARERVKEWLLPPQQVKLV